MNVRQRINPFTRRWPLHICITTCTSVNQSSLCTLMTKRQEQHWIDRQADELRDGRVTWFRRCDGSVRFTGNIRRHLLYTKHWYIRVVPIISAISTNQQFLTWGSKQEWSTKVTRTLFNHHCCCQSASDDEPSFTAAVNQPVMMMTTCHCRWQGKIIQLLTA